MREQHHGQGLAEGELVRPGERRPGPEAGSLTIVEPLQASTFVTASTRFPHRSHSIVPKTASTAISASTAPRRPCRRRPSSPLAASEPSRFHVAVDLAAVRHSLHEASSSTIQFDQLFDVEQVHFGSIDDQVSNTIRVPSMRSKISVNCRSHSGRQVQCITMNFVVLSRPSRGRSSNRSGRQRHHQHRVVGEHNSSRRNTSEPSLSQSRSSSRITTATAGGFDQVLGQRHGSARAWRHPTTSPSSTSQRRAARTHSSMTANRTRPGDHLARTPSEVGLVVPRPVRPSGRAGSSAAPAPPVGTGPEPPRPVFSPSHRSMSRSRRCDTGSATIVTSRPRPSAVAVAAVLDQQAGGPCPPCRCRPRRRRGPRRGERSCER